MEARYVLITQSGKIADEQVDFAIVVIIQATQDFLSECIVIRAGILVRIFTAVDNGLIPAAGINHKIRRGNPVACEIVVPGNKNSSAPGSTGAWSTGTMGGSAYRCQPGATAVKGRRSNDFGFAVSI